MQYLLLNKDSVWLNEYLEAFAYEDAWHTEQRPFGYRDLTDFLEQRKAPKHRAHIAELLKEYGCDTLEGFLRVTHALSLNDTFWVRPADSALQNCAHCKECPAPTAFKEAVGAVFFINLCSIGYGYGILGSSKRELGKIDSCLIRIVRKRGKVCAGEYTGVSLHH